MYLEIIQIALMVIIVWRIKQLEKWVFTLVKEVLYDKASEELSSKRNKS